VRADSLDERKLAAIMFTDMVGYSALAQRDEKLALELLEEHRNLLRPIFTRFNGVEVKTIGDAFLIEFPSALGATQCAIEIQRALAKRNHDVPVTHRIDIKIGIHIGDVIHRGSDVLGDGVNIASRIEPLAGPGGICISVDVERQIRSAIEISLIKLAPTELKNIRVPMELFRVELPWTNSAKAEDRSKNAETGLSRRAFPASRFAFAVAVVVATAAGLGGWLARHARRSGIEGPTPGRITSLAVKPLDDFSGDTNQVYFSDGMTEALCASLGNISSLRVPGRSSVMRFKGGTKSIQEMGNDLRVDAILEGSVQHLANRMLVTVQLVEVASDRHVWATNFNRDVSDFFMVQNELALAIANEVRARLTPEDRDRLGRARPANRDAVDACLLGMHQLRKVSDDGFTNALKHFQRAIAIDPIMPWDFAGAAWLTHKARAGGCGLPRRRCQNREGWLTRPLSWIRRLRKHTWPEEMFT
jgi:class 3 adenylate cyclase/TolB-like protein